MSDCIHKRWRSYIDPYSKDIRHIEYPCGRCAACLKKAANQWRVRLSETLYSQTGFIYDTLTVRDDAFCYIDCREEMEDILLPPKARKLLSKYDYFVPIFPVHYVRAWLKRGRELWNYDHRKDIAAGKCSRLKLRYFGCLEYGPKTSRPHVHICVIGVSHGDYIKYFAKSWRRDYGFTKTYYIHKDGKSVRNVVKYISKYINKGCFDSPLVLSGNQPKTFRVISHGIGIEYLDNPKMKFFNDPRFSFLRTSWDSSGDSDIPDNIVDLYSSEKALTLSEDELNKLTKYYDENGFCYSLPRYYLHKFTKAYDKTYLHSAVSRIVYQTARVNRNQEISRYATSLGITPRYQPESPLFDAWLCSRLGSLVYERYLVAKKGAALVENSRSKIELRNHFKRPLTARSGVFSSLTI